jgi:hypothetical protein
MKNEKKNPFSLVTLNLIAQFIEFRFEKKLKFLVGLPPRVPDHGPSLETPLPPTMGS